MSLHTAKLLLVLACLAAQTPRHARAEERTDSRLQGSRRVERDGWIYVRLEGTPERIGFQHGYLLAEEFADLLRVMPPLFQHTTKRDWEFYRKAGENMLWEGVEPEYRLEIDGIVAGLNARGVKADRWDVLAVNAAEELPYYYVPWLDKREGKPPTTHSPGNCSAFIATGRATKDGRIVMGHNTWTNYVVGSRWNIIFDINPEHGARILMDGLPGVIVSDDDFSVTSAGLLVTETTITQFEGWDPAGKPEFSRGRKAVQYARSIDDFVRIMREGNNGGYANDWLVGDNKTGEIALFELGLKEWSVRRTADGVYVGSNFPVDPRLIEAETTFDTRNRASSPNARRTRWEQLVSHHHGKIDLELGKAFELDTYDVIDNSDGANDRTLFGAVEVSVRGVPEWDWGPYFPGGSVQAKVTDGASADRMAFWAAFGHPVGPPFVADEFLKSRPQYEWMRGLLRDVKSHPWSEFRADMK
jgi:hypothetical protein